MAQGHSTSDADTLTITDGLDVLRPDGTTWELCERHRHPRTLAEVLQCLIWESLAELPPADLYGLWVETWRIVLPGVEPFIAVFYGQDEEFPEFGRTLDEDGRPLCWRTVAEAAGVTAAEAAEVIRCPSCQHPQD